MSRFGGATAFAAEAALWVAGAALIAGAAGLRVDLPGVGSETGSPSPSVAAKPTASPAPSLAVASAVPANSPAAASAGSSIIDKYLAVVAAPDFQFKAKFIETQTGAAGATPNDYSLSGTMSYKGGDDAGSQRLTMNGAVTTYDFVHLGTSTYVSKNGAAWARSDRTAADTESDRLLFTPSMQFDDQGIETKNSLQLHRLDAADPAAFSAALLAISSGATDGLLTYTVWVDDQGLPADFLMSGWMSMPVNGVSTRMNISEEFRIVATTGVNIAAPI